MTGKERFEAWWATSFPGDNPGIKGLCRRAWEAASEADSPKKSPGTPGPGLWVKAPEERHGMMPAGVDLCSAGRIVGRVRAIPDGGSVSWYWKSGMGLAHNSLWDGLAYRDPEAAKAALLAHLEGVKKCT